MLRSSPFNDAKEKLGSMDFRIAAVTAEPAEYALQAISKIATAEKPPTIDKRTLRPPSLNGLAISPIPNGALPIIISVIFLS